MFCENRNGQERISEYYERVTKGVVAVMKVQSNELHLKRCFELCWDEICSTIFNKERGQPRFLNFPALRCL